MSDGAITLRDRLALAGFCLKTQRFSQGEQVRKFEKEWSKWQGCKYSVFVNSGSSANLLLASALAEPDAIWICQAVTWSTNISPLLQLGQQVVLVDVDSSTLKINVDHLRDLIKRYRPRYLFATHIIGCCSLSHEIIELCRENNIFILEDTCESHGAKFTEGNFLPQWVDETEAPKLGNLGLASTFSFYYGHHMTSIEGGMICTDDQRLYEKLILLRSHGLNRELAPYGADCLKTMWDNLESDIDPKYLFVEEGYNVRNTEIAAFLGRRQLRRLDEYIVHRRNIQRIFWVWCENFKSTWLSTSPFCIPLFSYWKEDLTRLKKLLDKFGVEYRPLISGNILKQPFIRNSNKILNKEDSFAGAEIIDECAIYIGNHQGISPSQARKLCDKIQEFMI